MREILLGVLCAAVASGCSDQEPVVPSGRGGTWVPGGPAWVGTLELDKDTGRPTENYCQDEFHASFGRWMQVEGVFLDADEVSVRDYERCVENGGCPERPFRYVVDER